MIFMLYLNSVFCYFSVVTFRQENQKQVKKKRIEKHCCLKIVSNLKELSATNHLSLLIFYGISEIKVIVEMEQKSVETPFGCLYRRNKPNLFIFA